MRIIIGVLLLAATVRAVAVAAGQAAARAAAMQPASTMSELMVKIIYPASDAIFYITTREPKTEAEWVELQGKALAVAESANLLMMPGRARDQDRWMQDAKLMLDAGRAAFRAAKAKDVAALDALNDQLYTSCTSCHQHYRPNYGRRPARRPPVPPSSPAHRAAAPPPHLAPNLPRPHLAPLRRSRPWKAAGSCATAEDLRADGTVARLPWGEHPVGSIVVERGACYVQIMSSDTPSFARGHGAADRADEGDAAQLVHRLLGAVHDQRGGEQRDAEGRRRVASRLRRHGAEALLPLRERRAAVRPGAGIDPRGQRSAHAPADARPRSRRNAKAAKAAKQTQPVFALRSLRAWRSC